MAKILIVIKLYFMNNNIIFSQIIIILLIFPLNLGYHDKNYKLINETFILKI